MRTIVNLNCDWAFSKDTAQVPIFVPENWQTISLPTPGMPWTARMAALTTSAVNAAMSANFPRSCPPLKSTIWKSAVPTPPQKSSSTESVLHPTTAATPPGAWM